MIADFLAGFGIQEQVQPLAPANPHVVIAFGTNFKISLHFRTIQNGITTRTLAPQSLRNGALTGSFGADLGRHQFMKPTQVDNSLYWSVHGGTQGF